jgi:hypothetical protein
LVAAYLENQTSGGSSCLSWMTAIAKLQGHARPNCMSYVL